MAGDDGSGPIRRALTGLLDAWLDLDRGSAPALGRAREQAAVVARAVGPRHGALAEQVPAKIALGASAASDALADLTRVFADEAGALVSLLTGVAGSVTPAALGSGPGAVVDAFPSGAARHYVADLVTDAAHDHRQPSSAAEQVPAVNAISLSVAAGVRAAFDGSVGEAMLAMVCHPRGHAVQLHGPDVPDEALMARVSWKKDPMGRTDTKNSWRRDADGTVHTKHALGHVAGKFTTVEALVKPLRALLAHAGGTIEGLHAYLDRNAPAGFARIFVAADDAGLAPGDSTGFRGAGTSTASMADHWFRARRDAMASGGGPMPIVRTDQIADNDAPGAAMILRKVDGDWMMITCYPDSAQGDEFMRMGAET
ncbi:hypothetical protein [Jiangella alba]|uniref:Uncharacterized protein n=1 Tax=Jiangella alba TaxID=561176 RepID=A0A1H5PV19_9ACTN|nr:hypothetical protein [Jiangella alba]SEF17575.1 hypothetical protein SAMN04488561_5940 [Jiangella alba]